MWLGQKQSQRKLYFRWVVKSYAWFHCKNSRFGNADTNSEPLLQLLELVTQNGGARDYIKATQDPRNSRDLRTEHREEATSEKLAPTPGGPGRSPPKGRALENTSGSQRNRECALCPLGKRGAAPLGGGVIPCLGTREGPRGDLTLTGAWGMQGRPEI